MKVVRVAVAAACLLASASAFAFDVVVSQWGLGMYGTPFAVAMEKGFFKEQGADVSGFIGGAGGGTTLRNVLASPVPYGEVAVGAAVAAIQQGVKLTIVNGGVVSLADMLWVTRPDAPINSIQDLKGKAIAYSNPKSVTDMVSILALEKAGIFNQVKRVAVGGLGAGLTALKQGTVDATFVIEPIYGKERQKGNVYKVAFSAASLVPRFTQSVGVVRTDYLLEHPQQIRALIAARCKAVEYIRKNPQESAAILARAYKLDPSVAASAIDLVQATKSPYWSLGGFDYEGMNTVLDGMRRVNAIQGDFDWSKVVDEHYLSPECNKL